MGRRLLLCALVVGTVGAAARVEAARTEAAMIEGVRFVERLEASDLEFRLHAVGVLRYMTVFKAYAAALYLGPGCDPAAILEDTPKRLEISYFHRIGALDFVAATRTGMARNVPAARLRDLEPRLRRLEALYRDVEPGDRYALTYVPGVGTELALNGERLGVIDGSDFAAAMFAIWFGAREADPSLKRELLGLR